MSCINVVRFRYIFAVMVSCLLLAGCDTMIAQDDAALEDMGGKVKSEEQISEHKPKFLKVKPHIDASESFDMEKYIRPIPTIETLPPYRLQVGDVLQIKFLLNSEFNEEVVIRPDGMISTLIAQDVQAYGRTAAELQEKLIDIYEGELSDPRLAVIVKSFSPMRISVLGEVGSPGEMVAVDPNVTLLQAIARAGGILASANTGKVLVLRRGAYGQEGFVFEADYKAAISGRDPSQNMRLTSHDVVIVPRSGIANVYHYYRQFIQQFLPSSFGLGYELD